MACSKFPAAHKVTPESTALKAIYPTKLGAYNTALTIADQGWPSVTDCDSDVWAGTACLGGASVVISLAEWNPGEIHRRPKISGECYKAPPPDSAASTISRDDLILYMGCTFYQKDVVALDRLQAYATAHGGWMGMPQDPNYTLLTPTLAAILSRGIAKLGGPEGNPGVDIEAPGLKDYQDNIEVEEVMLSTAVNGGKANGWELGLLQSLEAQYPNDALFQAAKGIYSGDCTIAPQLLLADPVNVPTYVRGDAPELYAQAWWLRAASLVLSHCH